MAIGELVLEYCLNAVWLVPLVAGTAWLLVKVSNLRPAAEHRLWLGALLVCLTLPAIGSHAHRKNSPAPVASSWATPDPKPVLLADLPASPRPSMRVPEAFAPATPRAQATSPRNYLAGRHAQVRLAPRLVPLFGWVYAAVIAIAVVRLVRSWAAAMRLVREASPYALGEAEKALLRELSATFGIGVPRVLQSARVRSPVVVGLRHPLLLLPATFSRYSEPDRRAALCHELTHLRRRDCFTHALVQVVMLPLIWHPAMHFVSRRIAGTREMACDQTASAAMRSGAEELVYARSLLNLARKMIREEDEVFANVGLGLFRTNKLEERVMRLTEVKRVFTLRELLVRRVGGVAFAGMVLAASMMVHVAPVVAQQSAPLAPSAAPTLQTPAAPVAPEPPSVLPRRPDSQAARHHAPPARSADGGVGTGSSVGEGPSGTATGTDVFVDDHFAVARGQNAHVAVSPGRTLHHWVGADGQPYESADEQPGELTAQQQRTLEAEFARRMAQLDAQVAYWKSPAWKKQLRDQAGLAAAEAGVAAASAALDSPEFKAEMAHLDSPEFKAQMDAQMDALNHQMAQLKSKPFEEGIRSLTAAQVEAQLALAQKQAALAGTPAMQRKLDDAARRLDEAAARLDAATRALAEAQRRLQQTPAR